MHKVHYLEYETTYRKINDYTEANPGVVAIKVSACDDTLHGVFISD